jgi:alpha-beta hydrolase superfamily lysophospholipase
LGTGIVVDYAAKHEWLHPIILISPYKSIGTVVFDNPSSSIFVSPVDKFKTLDKLSELKCPVKIFHGKKDDVIDIKHAETIFENLPDQTLEPVWIQNADHNNILEKLLDKEYYEDMKQIIEYS